MKKLFALMGASLLVSGLPVSTQAANRWWKGGAGTLDNGTANFYSTDATGGTLITAGTADTVFFSAGSTFTAAYSMAGTVTYGGLTVEEGTITIATTVTTGAGPVVVNNGGTLAISVSTSLNTTPGSVLTLNGGRFRNSNTSTTGSFIDTETTIVLGTGGGIISGTGGAAAQTIVQPTTVISGTGPLVKDGNAIIAVAALCTYSGATVVNDGTLRCRTTANVFPTGTDLTVTSPGVFSLNGINQQVASVTGNGSVTLGSATLTIGGSTSPVAFSGIISSTTSGDVTKQGSGTLTLSGVNDFNGTLTLSQGTITVTSSGKLCNPVCDVVVNGGTLNLNNASQNIENLSGTNGTINLGSGHVLTSDPIASTSFTGTIAGAGGLTRSNANATTRTLTLSGPNTYSGNTTIGAGNIAVASATALGTTAGFTTVASGAEILFTGSTVNFTCAEPLKIAGIGNTDGGAISVIASATPTLSGPVTLTGDATITVSSTCALTLSNTNAISSLANQNLTLQGGSGAGAGGTVSGMIDLGSGTLTKAQGGKWVLGASNSYSGGTIISAGTLDAQVAGGFGNGNVSVSAGATLRQESSSAINSSANLALGGTTSIANLNFVGTQTINALTINGIAKAAGTWGAVGSGAAHTSSQITGTGLLNVTTGPVTSTALISSLNPSTYGDSVTLTATITGATPSGTVTFKDGPTPIGTSAVSSVVASLTITNLSAGTSPHSITAVYSGDDNNGGSTSSSVSQVVNVANQTITFATVADKTYGASFNPGATASSGLPISYSVVSGPASVAANLITVTNLGSVTIRASQPGNADYNAASDVDQSFSVNPATLLVSADSFTRIYGATNPPLTISYTGFQLNEELSTSDVTGIPDIGTLADASSPIGDYIITNAVGTLTSTHYTFSYASGTLTVTNAFTTNVVSASPNPVPTGNALTLSTEISALTPSPVIPDGSVQFLIDGIPFGNPVTLVDGIASTNTSLIPHGIHTLTAQYAGNTNLIGSTNNLSPQLVVNSTPVTQPDSILRPDNGGTKVSFVTLISNDTDADLDTFVVVSVSGTSAEGGTVTTNSTHVFYTPPAGNPAIDTFTYSVSDGFGTLVTATVTVTKSSDNGPSSNITRLTTLGDGNKQINFAGIPGRNYLIQGTTNMTLPINWTTLSTNSAGTNGLFEFIDLNATNFDNRYYRTTQP